MPHDLTAEEVSFTVGLIAKSPVSITWEQMPVFYQRGESCIRKLQAGLAQPAAAPEPVTAADLAAAMTKVQKPQEGK